MKPEPQPDTVPSWVLQEVGRLHLHALAMERELAACDERWGVEVQRLHRALAQQGSQEQQEEQS